MPVDFHQMVYCSFMPGHITNLTGQKAILFGICPMAACYFQLCVVIFSVLKVYNSLSMRLLAMRLLAMNGVVSGTWSGRCIYRFKLPTTISSPPNREIQPLINA